MNRSTEILIRPAQKEDAYKIARVHIVTWQTAYRGQLPDTYLDSLSVEKRATVWDKRLEASALGASTFVAEESGHIVGFIDLTVPSIS